MTKCTSRGVCKRSTSLLAAQLAKTQDTYGSIPIHVYTSGPPLRNTHHVGFYKYVNALQPTGLNFNIRTKTQNTWNHFHPNKNEMTFFNQDSMWQSFVCKGKLHACQWQFRELEAIKYHSSVLHRVSAGNVVPRNYFLRTFSLTLSEKFSLWMTRRRNTRERSRHQNAPLPSWCVVISMAKTNQADFSVSILGFLCCGNKKLGKKVRKRLDVFRVWRWTANEPSSVSISNRRTRRPFCETRMFWIHVSFSVVLTSILDHFGWKHVAIIFENLNLLNQVQGAALRTALREDPRYPRPYDIEYAANSNPDFKAMLKEAGRHARGETFDNPFLMCFFFPP